MEYSSLDNNAFVWPIPPYFYFANEAGGKVDEPCLIAFYSGKELAGHLILFSAEHSRILFQPENGNIRETILFNQITCLKLTRPVKMIREQIFFETLTDEDALPPVEQSYVVEFTNNTRITGLTSGFVNTEAGLYLYPHLEQENVARYFIPQHAIKSYKINVPLDGMSIEGASGAANANERALKYKSESLVKNIDDYLIKNQINSAEELKLALTQHESLPLIKLGNALQRAHLLTDEQLQEALEKQKQNPALRLGQVLIDTGIINRSTLNSVLAKKLGFLNVNLAKFDFDPKAIGIVNESLARKLLLMPLCFHEDKLVAAFEDPLNAQAIDELGFNTQKSVVVAMALHEDIISAIENHYKQVNSGLASGIEYGSDVKLNNDGSIDFKW